MGTACGCTHEPPEYEVATIDLAKAPFDEIPNQHLAIPMVDLEQEFSNIVNEIRLDNSIVNVYLVLIARKNVIKRVLLTSMQNLTSPYLI